MPDSISGCRSKLTGSRSRNDTKPQAAIASGMEGRSKTGIDFEVGVLHTSPTLLSGTKGLVSG